MSASDLRDEVAAHQAECSCHPVEQGVCEDTIGWRGEPEAGSRIMATDSAGSLWHIDPLCKVRPGRGVE